MPLSVFNPCLPTPCITCICCFCSKCCVCSCSGSACGFIALDCLDPDADDEFYECEAPPPASLPCSAEGQREWVVDDAAQAQALTAAVNCSGGSFEVEWRGTVVVDEPIYVADGTSLTISGAAGSTASVDGNSSTRLFTVVNAALHLDGLNISYGASTVGGAIAATGSTLTFNRTNFVGNSASGAGGAVFVSDASSVSCAHRTTFVENRAGSGGGGMFVSGGSEISCGGRWLSNSALANGGALRAQDESSVSWSEDSIFEFNVAGGAGGALSLVNASSVSWDAPTGFYYNNAGVYGGALVMSDQCVAFWQAGTGFFSNSAGESGGAVFLRDDSNVSWSGDTSTVFDGNQAVQFGGGGALAVTTGSRASCTADTTATFSGNSAADGGAIWVAENSSLSLYGASSFEDNAAIGDPQSVNSTGDGGAVILENATATFDGAVMFTGNRAQHRGGALIAKESNVMWNTHTMTAIFNAAVFGGAIYMYSASMAWDGEATMMFNNASDVGGAFFMVQSNASWVGKLNFSSNVAELGAGALFVGDGSIATWNGDATFAENAADGEAVDAIGQGGAVVIRANSSVVWSGGMTQFIGNVAAGTGSAIRVTSDSHLSWSGPMTKFTNNSGGFFGAIYVRFASEVFWSGETLFEGNNASSGGAIFVLDGSYVGWTGETTFSSNEATIDGGAVASMESDPIYNPRNSTLHIGATTTFLNNTSGANGGGLSLLGACTLEVDAGVEVSYVGNSAKVAGGAVFVSGAGAGPAFSRATFVSNLAQVGGAVSTFGCGNSKSIGEVEPPDPTTFYRCRFVGNRATTGGAIDSTAGYDSVIDSTFEDNAAGTGGALRLAGTAAIDGCSFVENFSEDGGGAVISNIGTIVRMANISFAGNGFNCPAGMFLDYNMVSRCLHCSWASRSPLLGLTCACLKLLRPNGR